MDKILNYDYVEMLTKMFSNLSLDIVLKVIIVYFFVLRIAIIIWVTKDIINRTNNIFFQLIAIFIVLFGTPFSVAIYFLIRPSNTLFEKYYEEDFDDSFQEELNQEKQQEIGVIKISCPECSYIIKSDYKYCPNCRVKLKNDCIGCGKELKNEWSMCPYCGRDQDKKVENILSKTVKKVQENKIEVEVKEKEAY